MTWFYEHRAGCQVGIMGRRYPIGALANPPGPTPYAYGEHARYKCTVNPSHLQRTPGYVRECPFCWAEHEVLAAAKGER